MTQDVYSRFKNYDKIYRIASSKLILPPEIHIKIVKELKGTILDIGTADGAKLENILQDADLNRIKKVIAIEPSPLYKRAKERFKKKSNNLRKKVEIVNVALEDLTTKEKFDVVFMFEVIEHVDKPEILLEKITTMLKPNGIFICSTPNKWIYRITERLIGKKPDPTHINEMTYKQFINLMNTYFKETEFMGVLPFMTIARKCPKLFVLNKYFNFLPICRTIYCFARKPRRFDNENTSSNL